MRKVLCIISFSRLTKFVPLHDHQYGFRLRCGTQHALLNLARLLRRRRAGGAATYVLFLAWSKAYDQVTHEAVLAGLAAKSVQHTVWRIIDSLYQSAQSRCRIDGELSRCLTPLMFGCGVAQGCQLSPFLYAVYAD